MSEWAIRTGTRADIPSVLDLWEAAAPLPSATDSEDGLERLLDRDPEALLLADAEVEAEPIGSLIAAWAGWRGSFYRLAAHPNWRRQGLATALVRAGEHRLERLGAVRLAAIAASDELAAVSLWESAGYERQADRSRFVRMLRA